MTRVVFSFSPRVRLSRLSAISKDGVERDQPLRFEDARSCSRQRVGANRRLPALRRRRAGRSCGPARDVFSGVLVAANSVFTPDRPLSKSSRRIANFREPARISESVASASTSGDANPGGRRSATGRPATAWCRLCRRGALIANLVNRLGRIQIVQNGFVVKGRGFGKDRDTAIRIAGTSERGGRL